MFRIRRFGVIRTANVVGFLYLVVIAVIFVPIALIVAIAMPSTNLGGGGFAGNAGGIAVLFFGLLLAVFYAIVGWIFTALLCLLYNFAAGMVGGIEIQLEAVEPPPPAAVWGGTPSAPPAAPPPPAPPAG
jgi:hypothetical protein